MEKTLIKVKSYRCTNCLKVYSSKVYFDRHIACCKLMMLNDKERNLEIEKNQDIPSIDKLYEIIKTLVTEQNKMKKELDTLKRFVNTKKKQIDVFEYLNKSIKPLQTYKQWIQTLDYTNDDLDVLLEETYLNAMNKYFENLFGNINEEDLKIPIRAFTEKQNILYIYEYDINENNEDEDDNEQIQKEPKWIKLNDDYWKLLIKHITSLMFDKFKEWQDENEDRFEEESFSIKYHSNIKKIMSNIGHPLTSYQKKVWSLIKLDFKNIVTYELE